MLISGQALIDLTKKVVEGDNLVVNRCEIDVHLGKFIFREKQLPACQRIHQLGAPLDQLFSRHEVVSDVSIKPKEFILAETREFFKMPSNVSGMVTLRSFAAKAGLEQSSSLTLKPDWSGHLILELCNQLREHELLLEPDAPIAQIQFFTIPNPWVASMPGLQLQPLSGSAACQPV